MKKLLVICDSFAPDFAPRMSAICKYIRNFGWQPYVLTENNNLNIDYSLSQLDIEVNRLEYYSQTSSLNNQFKKAKHVLSNSKDKALYKLFQSVYNNIEFDAVLCSTYLLFPINTAIAISHEKNIPLIVDFRDIVEQYGGVEFFKTKLPVNDYLYNKIALWYKRIIIKRRTKLLPKFNAVTSVSKWHVNFLSQFNKNTHLIYNGFDEEFFFQNNIESSKFNIVYTGTVHSLKMQDPSLFFKAIKQLEKTNIIDKSNFSVSWYTDINSQNLIRKCASEYQVTEFMQFFKTISADKIPSILHNSSLALVLTNRPSANGPFGIMTTKYFEAVGARKPVLCVPNDGGCLGELINETNTGLAANTVDEICDYIIKLMQEFKTNKFTISPAADSDINQFSRKKQAEQFAEILNTLIKK